MSFFIDFGGFEVHFSMNRGIKIGVKNHQKSESVFGGHFGGFFGSISLRIGSLLKMTQFLLKKSQIPGRFERHF